MQENLSSLFNPASVVLVGASQREGLLGNLIARNLIASGFKGELLAVNSKYQQVQGIRCYANMASLPAVPDLAVTVTPAQTVPRLIKQLGEHSTHAAIVINAGFGESGTEQGERLHKSVLSAARKYKVRILGPNCLVDADYVWVTEKIMQLAQQHSKGRIVSVLEGGYALNALGRCAAAHVKELMR